MGILLWIGVILLVLLVIVGILVRYEDSQSFRYRFKFSFHVFYVSFVCLLSIPFAAFRPKNVENTLMIAPFVKFASKLLGVRWEIQGMEILASDIPCVVICNHQSILDTLGMAEVWSVMRKCACVAKKELIYIFPFGLAAWLCGTVFIDRSKGSKSIVKLSTTADSVQKSKTKLWIFPEGTRHKGEELLPFKKGAFHIAMQCKLPIVPVVISPYTFIDDGKEVFGQGKMLLSILPPIPTRDVTDVNELLDKTRDLMNIEFKRLSKIVNSPASSKSVHENNTGIRLSSNPVTLLVEAKKIL